MRKQPLERGSNFVHSIAGSIDLLGGGLHEFQRGIGRLMMEGLALQIKITADTQGHYNYNTNSK